MSFTPYGADGCKSGIVDSRFQPLPVCCVNRNRRCASMPFLYQVQDPPWYCCPPKCVSERRTLVRLREYDYQLTYDNQQEYLNPLLEDRVMPAMAFWFYCDQIPDLPEEGDVPQHLLKIQWSIPFVNIHQSYVDNRMVVSHDQK